MKTVKKVKPAFIVDLTDAVDVNDIYVCFGLAKQEAGLPMTNREFDSIVRYITLSTKDITYFDIFRGYNAVVLDGGALHRLTAHKVDDECECKDCNCDCCVKKKHKKPCFIKRLLRKLFKK